MYHIYIVVWTYVVNGVNKRVVTAITHGEPVKAEVNYIDVFISETKNKKNWLSYTRIYKWIIENTVTRPPTPDSWEIVNLF